MHGYLNTNKKSIRTLHPEELKNADLVIYDQNIDQIDESTIETSTSAVSWFGKTGPYNQFKGSDAMIQSLIGQVRTIGPPGGTTDTSNWLPGSNYRRVNCLRGKPRPLVG